MTENPIPHDVTAARRQSNSVFSDEFLSGRIPEAVAVYRQRVGEMHRIRSRAETAASPATAALFVEAAETYKAREISGFLASHPEVADHYQAVLRVEETAKEFAYKDLRKLRSQGFSVSLYGRFDQEINQYVEITFGAQSAKQFFEDNPHLVEPENTNESQLLKEENSDQQVITVHQNGEVIGRNIQIFTPLELRMLSILKGADKPISATEFRALALGIGKEEVKTKERKSMGFKIQRFGYKLAEVTLPLNSRYRDHNGNPDVYASNDTIATNRNATHYRLDSRIKVQFAEGFAVPQLTKDEYLVDPKAPGLPQEYRTVVLLSDRNVRLGEQIVSLSDDEYFLLEKMIKNRGRIEPIDFFKRKIARGKEGWPDWAEIRQTLHAKLKIQRADGQETGILVPQYNAGLNHSVYWLHPDATVVKEAA